MTIIGWAIDGFGVFRDYENRELSAGLTVFHGPNEAGKTTLLAFLRGVLFGFPDRRGGQPRYPPQDGGRHGGRVFLRGPDGEYVVDRDAERRVPLRLTLPDGRAGSEDDLHRLLAGADAQLFRAIFAFTLTELQSFASLSADGVRERIFAAGVVGAGASARQVVGSVNERMRLLLRRNGRARINELLRHLEAAGAAVDSARQAAIGYEDRRAEEEECRRTLAETRSAIDDTRRELECYVSAVDLWPTWGEGADARAALAQLEPIGDLARDAPVHLATATSQMEALRRQLDALQAEQVQDLARHRALAAGPPVAAAVAAQARWLPPRFVATLMALLLAVGTAGAAWRGALHDRSGVMAILGALVVLGLGLEWLRRWAALREREQRGRLHALAAAIEAGAIAGAIEQRAALVAAAADCLAQCTRASQRVLAEAGARDAADFDRRWRIQEQRHALLRTDEECERHVTARLGDGAGAAAMRALLATGNVNDWQAQIRALEQRLAELERARDSAVRRHHDAERARRELEESSDVAAREGEREGLRAELAAAVHEWRVLALAQGLMGETLRELERTRQPRVLTEASATFAAITDGRYVRVAEGEEREVVVFEPGGRRKRLDELSRGTAEQLYLSIRFALAGEFARRSAPLPLIMDEVLVNFDPARARRVAAVLADFARAHQVLFFTCHPATRDLLCAVDAATRVVELGGGGQVASAG